MDLINKQEALRLLKLNYDDSPRDTGDLMYNDGVRSCIKTVREMKAVEVVRCRECDLWNDWDHVGRESLGTYRCSCAEWSSEASVLYTGPEEFCSRGERKEEDEE
jgi:hypothetical protein